MKAIKQYFHVALFIMLYKLVLTLNKTLACDHSNESYFKKPYFHVVLFIMLYNVALTFTSMDETLVCGHSNESENEI